MGVTQMVANVDRAKDGKTTLGADIVPLGRYKDVQTHEGHCLIYDTDIEDAWLQSDLFFDCRSSI